MWLRVLKAAGFVSLLSGAALTVGQSQSADLDPMIGANLYAERGCSGCHDTPVGRIDHSVVNLSGNFSYYQSALDSSTYHAGSRGHAPLNHEEIGHLSAFLAKR